VGVIARAPRDSEGLVDCTEDQDEKGEERERVVQSGHGQLRISRDTNEEEMMIVCSIVVGFVQLRREEKPELYLRRGECLTTGGQLGGMLQARDPLTVSGWMRS
jgi:hypothetical protein